MHDGLLGKGKYGLIIGMRLVILLNQHQLMTHYWTHEIKDLFLDHIIMDGSLVINCVCRLAHRDIHSHCHKVATIREISLTSSHRLCHRFSRKQDRWGVQLQDNLGELDTNQLQDLVTYMGITLPWNVNRWILGLDYQIMRTFLYNPHWRMIQ